MTTLNARANQAYHEAVKQAGAGEVVSDEDYDRRISMLLGEQRAAWARGDRQAALAARAVVLKMTRGSR